MPGLPFGRPASQPPKPQFIDERRRSIPRVDGWVLSTLSGEAFTELADGAVATANLLVLSRLDRLTVDYTLTKASIAVSAGSAGTFAYSGLYILDSAQPTRLFKLVPGTKVTFDAGSTARVDVTLPLPVKLYEGSQLFLGSLVSSVVPTFTLAQANTTNVEKVRTFSATSLPGEVMLSSTTGSTTIASTLHVVYYSREAAIVCG